MAFALECVNLPSEVVKVITRGGVGRAERFKHTAISTGYGKSKAWKEQIWKLEQAEPGHHRQETMPGPGWEWSGHGQSVWGQIPPSHSQLFYFQQVTYPSHASVSSPIKWRQEQSLRHAASMTNECTVSSTRLVQSKCSTIENCCLL